MFDVVSLATINKLLDLLLVVFVDQTLDHLHVMAGVGNVLNTTETLLFVKALEQHH